MAPPCSSPPPAHPRNPLQGLGDIPLDLLPPLPPALKSLQSTVRGCGQFPPAGGGVGDSASWDCSSASSSASACSTVSCPWCSISRYSCAIFHDGLPWPRPIWPALAIPRSPHRRTSSPAASRVNDLPPPGGFLFFGFRGGSRRQCVAQRYQQPVHTRSHRGIGEFPGLSPYPARRHGSSGIRPAGGRLAGSSAAEFAPPLKMPLQAQVAVGTGHSVTSRGRPQLGQLEICLSMMINDLARNVHTESQSVKTIY